MQSSLSPAIVILLASLVCCAFLLQTSAAKSLTSGEKALYPTDMDNVPPLIQRLLLRKEMVEDDGSVDNALINYLFARQMVNRLRNNMDIGDLQRKRSYWKQCAFNAVSCFGKKK